MDGEEGEREILWGCRGGRRRRRRFY